MALTDRSGPQPLPKRCIRHVFQRCLCNAFATICNEGEPLPIGCRRVSHALRRRYSRKRRMTASQAKCNVFATAAQRRSKARPLQSAD
jgi:hypothetical protein